MVRGKEPLENIPDLQIGGWKLEPGREHVASEATAYLWCSGFVPCCSSASMAEELRDELHSLCS